MALKNFVIIALGSNLGNRRKNLAEGIKRLKLAIADLKCSGIYETAAMLPDNAPADWDMPFYNCVCCGETELSVHDMLVLCNKIEKENSPEKRSKGSSGPRYLDIDILAYGNEVHETPELKIPHPGILKRNFVLAPLSEILPDWVHPLTGKKISEYSFDLNIDKVSASGL